MARRFFPHAKWPKWLVGLHTYTIVSFLLLMISGILLFAPAVHARLIRVFPILYQIHIILGFIFLVTLVIPFFDILPKHRKIRRFDWWFPIVFGIAIVGTGILLWKVTWFSASWRSRGFVWHGRFAYILFAWIVIHAIYKALGFRPDNSGMNGRVDFERRRFLRWMGLGIGGAALTTMVDPLAFLRLGNPSKGSASGANQFAEFYTVTSGYPSMASEDYRLSVGGLVASPRIFTLSELQQMQPSHVTHDFNCVTGWSVAGVHWTGIHIRNLMLHVKPSSAVRYVNFYSFDGAYTESLSLAEATDATVLLAYELDGGALSKQQGYPVRLVVPKMYGYKSIKWVNRVEFSDKPLTGYWEQRGYPSDGYVGLRS